MEMKRRSSLLLAVTSAVAMVVMGAGMAFAAHPTVDSQGNAINIQLFTYEEIADQFVGDGDQVTEAGEMLPVVIQDAATMQGMPYSPKQTCGGCHEYDTLTKHAFHSAQGMREIQDTADGSFNAASIKPWTQSNGMFGKW